MVGTLCAAMPAQATEDDDPYGEVTEAAATTPAPVDLAFSNIFSSLQRMDGTPKATAYIPSGRPVEKLSLTSNYGTRSDPFNGRARMHKGIDIPGPVGTPIYATADGIVSRSGWASGYGNLGSSLSSIGSTGSHLHYEVRVDGAAINPIPFVAGPDYLVAANTKPPVAMGGPTTAQEKAAD